MDTSTSELVKKSIATAVRWVLVMIAGILVKKGIVSGADSELYVQQALPVVVGAAMGLLVLLWGLWEKRHANQKVDKALEMPAGTDRAKLEAKV